MARSGPWVLGVVAGLLSCYTVAAGQIIILKPVGDKTVQCMHTGLSSDLRDCGVQSDWYAYVFVGTISSVTPMEDGEKELHIIPLEIFRGEPPNPLVVRTSQGACFDKPLDVGDHWLFYLRSGNPIVLDFYGNISSPVADSKERIEVLRRLETIGDNGILRGRVKRGPFGQGEAVPNGTVLAHRATDDALFVATSDADGRYEFQPLAPGKYKVSVDPTKSFHADDASIQLNRGQCWDLTLSRSPHARLAGHVKHLDGSPVPRVQVLIANYDGSGYTTMQSDASGYFHMESMSPGKYVVGINLPGAAAWKYSGCGGACDAPQASLYYPNMRNRSDALVIDLATDEKREDIDFTIPPQ